MKRKSFEAMTCSVAQCLEAIGEWWTPLIVRDLLMGVHRFDDLQARLGIARNVLSDRLGRLVEIGVVARVRYQLRPERFEYRLTEKGADLWRVVDAMRDWGDRWSAPAGPTVELVHLGCGERTRLVPTCRVCRSTVGQDDLEMVDGPGSGAERVLPGPGRDG